MVKVIWSKLQKNHPVFTHKYEIFSIKGQLREELKRRCENLPKPQKDWNMFQEYTDEAFAKIVKKFSEETRFNGYQRNIKTKKIDISGD